MRRVGSVLQQASLLTTLPGRPLHGKRFISSAFVADEGEPFTDAVRRLGVKFVMFSFTDLLGTLRSKMVPAAQAPTLAETGAGFAAFANNFDYGPETPDVLATPDPQSLMVLPWNRKVAWVACDLSMGGSELTQGPRTALKRALRKLRDEHNMTFKTVSSAQRYCETSVYLFRDLLQGVELEFHLLSSDQMHTLADKNDTAVKPCYSIEPLMKQFDLISELQEAMELLGWEPYQVGGAISPPPAIRPLRPPCRERARHAHARACPVSGRRPSSIARPPARPPPLTAGCPPMRFSGGGGGGGGAGGPRGLVRAVRAQLALRRRAGHGGPARLLQVDGPRGRGPPRHGGHLHAQALRPPLGQLRPRPPHPPRRRHRPQRPRRRAGRPRGGGGGGGAVWAVAAGAARVRGAAGARAGLRRHHQPHRQLVQAHQRRPHRLRIGLVNTHARAPPPPPLFFFSLSLWFSCSRSDRPG